MGEKNYKYRKNTKKMENCLRRNTQGEAIRKTKNTNCHECTVLTTDSINVQRLTVTSINSVHIPAIKNFCVCHFVQDNTWWPQKVGHFSTHHVFGTVQEKKMKRISPECS